MTAPPSHAPARRRGAAPRRLGWLLGWPLGWPLGWLLACLSLALACGVNPDPNIADEFFERLAAPDRGWRPVPCADRARRIERVRGLVALAHELRARWRTFDTPLPPQLLERTRRMPMLGWADDYRCLVQDFTRIDLRHEPDFEEVRALVANLYVLEGSDRLERGQTDEGWAHVLEALDLYRDPVAPGLVQHMTLPRVLRAVDELIDAHPPAPPVIDALIDALDATALTPPVVCAAIRHQLLELAILDVRAHFGQREREATARRFGLDTAMRMWRTPQRPGMLHRAAWGALRDAYDLTVKGCPRRPYGRSIQRAVPPSIVLDSVHPPTSLRLRVIGDRINRIRPLTDARVALLARLHGRRIAHRQGRDPTTLELSLSFSPRPRNAWDGRSYSFVVGDGVVTVIRGPHRHTALIHPAAPHAGGHSYPEPPPPTRR